MNQCPDWQGEYQVRRKAEERKNLYHTKNSADLQKFLQNNAFTSPMGRGDSALCVSADEIVSKSDSS